jgi:hypothetical protein
MGNDEVEMVWEWATVSDIKTVQEVTRACAQASNSGFAVFGIYNRPSALAPSIHVYDVVVCRQRPINEREIAQRAAAQKGIVAP